MHWVHETELVHWLHEEEQVIQVFVDVLRKVDAGQELWQLTCPA